MGKGIYINDSIHGLIALSEYEKRIISSIGFNRLHDVYQNSTVYLTFPSNRTKRFEHSIGTMLLCSDMFFYSILNSDEQTLEEFYKYYETKCKDIINEIINDNDICMHKLDGKPPKKNTLPNIEFGRAENSVTPYNVPPNYRCLHLLLIQSIRAAALLHDIGHPPFSHVVEDSLKKASLNIKNHNDNCKHRENFITLIENYLGDDRKLHEQMGNEIAESVLREAIRSLSEDEAYEQKKYNKALYDLMCLKIVIRIFKAKDGESFFDLHSIIDSSVDGDRLDYVTRDSINSGINSGRIDYKRIINDMKLRFIDSKAYFCIPLKAINSVEDFIKRRYNIYKTIIFHHRVIKTDFLLANIVNKLIINYFSNEIIDNDSNMDLIPYNISGLWFPLGNSTDMQKSIALSQWNDSWLMVVLKQEYYKKYIGCNENDKNYVLSQQMIELLRNRKVYHSIIKRSEDFKIIDDAIKEVLDKASGNLIKIIDKALSKEKNDNCSSKDETPNKTSDSITNISSEVEKLVKINSSLERIKTLFKISKEKQCFNGFLLAYIKRHYDLFLDAESFTDSIENIVLTESKNTFTNLKHYDTIIIFNKITIGLDKPIYFYDSNNKRYTLNEVSGISDILGLETDFLPVFYIYILLKNGQDIIKEKKEELLKGIGNHIGKKTLDNINNMLNKI